jgi:hypothetical protein
VNRLPNPLRPALPRYGVRMRAAFLGVRMCALALHWHAYARPCLWRAYACQHVWRGVHMFGVHMCAVPVRFACAVYGLLLADCLCLQEHARRPPAPPPAAPRGGKRPMAEESTSPEKKAQKKARTVCGVRMCAVSFICMPCVSPSLCVLLWRAYACLLIYLLLSAVVCTLANNPFPLHETGCIFSCRSCANWPQRGSSSAR